MTIVGMNFILLDPVYTFLRNRVGPPLAIADAGLAGPEVEVEADVEA